MKNYLKNMTTFSGKGRVTRREFFAFALSVPILLTIIFVLFTIIILPYAKNIGADTLTPIMMVLVFTTVIYFGLIGSFMIGKRLNDTGRNHLYILLALIPYLGVLIGLYFMLEKPVVGSNQHGPDPRQIQ
jgi:uncharacterized membrane protein YhaH (DUF805 family)